MMQMDTIHESDTTRIQSINMFILKVIRHDM